MNKVIKGEVMDIRYGMQGIMFPYDESLNLEEGDEVKIMIIK